MEKTMSEDNKFVKVNRLDPIDGEQPSAHSPHVHPVRPPHPVVHPVNPANPPPDPWQPALNTEAGKIWAQIKSLPIHMFGLPNQTVEDYCFPVNITPEKLYLGTRASATLPALETTLLGRFTVELADKYVLVVPLPAPLAPKK
jgi:hypothetical protein